MAGSAVTLRPGEGECFAILGGTIRVLVPSSATGGQLAVLECTVTPGDGPPLHRHEREDELFYVVAGRFKFSVNGERFIAEPGAFVYAPRGSVHSFRNIAETESRMTVTCSPGGIEEVFRATQIPHCDSGRAPLPMDEMIARFTAHGISFHGPPLDPS